MLALTIFRAGKHTASSGQSFDFSASDLEACVRAYDPSLYEAPLVVGHPTDNAPAYGWVKALAFAEGHVFAQPHQVDPGFREMVNSGRFKKISASFYLPDSPHNPKPGVLSLRHVGFLGAQPPAVKGLRDAAFGETEAGVVEYHEAEMSDVGELLRSIREWLIEKHGIEDADKVLPSWRVKWIEDSEPGPESAPENANNYSEGVGMPDKNQTLEAKAAELKAREDALNAREAAVKKADAPTTSTRPRRNSSRQSQRGPRPRGRRTAP